jgi:hypothetical protein
MTEMTLMPLPADAGLDLQEQPGHDRRGAGGARAGGSRRGVEHADAEAPPQAGRIAGAAMTAKRNGGATPAKALSVQVSGQNRQASPGGSGWPSPAGVQISCAGSQVLDGQVIASKAKLASTA